MAIFTVNGKDFDDLDSALEECKRLWHEYKAPGVAAQKVAALAKPTPLDVERAALGVVPDLGSVKVSKLGG